MFRETPVCSYCYAMPRPVGNGFLTHSLERFQSNGSQQILYIYIYFY